MKHRPGPAPAALPSPACASTKAVSHHTYQYIESWRGSGGISQCIRSQATAVSQLTFVSCESESARHLSFPSCSSPTTQTCEDRCARLTCFSQWFVTMHSTHRCRSRAGADWAPARRIPSLCCRPYDPPLGALGAWRPGTAAVCTAPSHPAPAQAHVSIAAVRPPQVYLNTMSEIHHQHRIHAPLPLERTIWNCPTICFSFDGISAVGAACARTHCAKTGELYTSGASHCATICHMIKRGLSEPMNAAVDRPAPAVHADRCACGAATAGKLNVRHAVGCGRCRQVRYEEVPIGAHGCNAEVRSACCESWCRLVGDHSVTL